MKILDFTLQKYEQLCKAMISSKYKIMTVKEYLLNPDQKGNIIILRHDVDRFPHYAYRIALIEHKFKINSTFYFRKIPGTFNPNIIQKIADLGNEIGYHYEVLAKSKGNMKKAIKLFKKELDEFNKIIKIKTISMHGSPLSQWNNSDLWKEYNFKKFGLLGDAFLSIDYNKVRYFSDTGRTWNSQKFNIRDKINSATNFEIETTDELIKIIKEQKLKRIALNIHPHRWTKNKIEYLSIYILDIIFNLIKFLIIKIR